MSVYTLSWVLRHSPTRLADRLVLIVLADKSEDDGTRAYPSVDTIAGQAKVSRRQAQISLRALEVAGHIIRSGIGPHRTTEYTVVMGADSAPPKGEDPSPGGRRIRPEGGEDSSPNPSFNPSSTHPDKGDPLDVEFEEWLEHHVATTGNKAGMKPDTQPHKRARAAYAERRREYPEEDLKLVSIGAMAHDYRREHRYTSAESVLRPSATGDLLERGRQAQPAQSDWQGDALLERTRRQYDTTQEDQP